MKAGDPQETIQCRTDESDAGFHEHDRDVVKNAFRTEHRTIRLLLRFKYDLDPEFTRRNLSEDATRCGAGQYQMSGE